MIFYRAPWLLSLYFVGNLSTLENGGSPLAAAALASTIANVTGLSIVIGLSSSLSTLSSQSYGTLQTSSTSSLPQFLTTGLTVHYMFTIPIFIIWSFTSIPYNLLILLGQDPILSYNTSLYLSRLSPGLLGHTLMFTLMPFCQSITLSHLPAISALIVAVLHVPLNMVLIPRWGFKGAAVCTSVTQCLGPGIVYFLTFYWKKRKLNEITKTENIGLFNGTSVKYVIKYLRLALPGLVTISEWWASEVAIFLSGRLMEPEISVSAMTIYQSLNSSCFMFSIGFSVAASSLVGKTLGQNLPSASKYNARVSTIAACVVSALLGTTMYISDHEILPGLFTKDVDVVRETARTLPLLSLYVFADGVQVTLSGVLKGCGMQVWMMPVVVFSYWFVALPFGYYVTFVMNEGKECGGGLCGVVGLTSGMCLGTWVHFLLMVWIVEFKIDWQKMSDRARETVGVSSALADTVDDDDDEEQGVEMMSPENTRPQNSNNDTLDSFFSGLTIKKTPTGYGKLEQDDDDESLSLVNSNPSDEELDYDKLAFGIKDDNNGNPNETSIDRLKI
ncbi:hypothetical protein TrST_g12257 [Triparma strigata]|uniref:Multidrug and toxic compound extrusion protein n=1 Tax=Triparma strigata TaxID=1606541 RepID=A0A9W7B9N7_9STRA|nr:hypothetical protein TrST_g12257 [Triparma strigata]